MKIWLGMTTFKFKEYKDDYFAIRNYLIEKGCVLTDDWLGNCSEWILKNPNIKRDIKAIYQSVTKAIDGSDVSIIEMTVPNFSSSHQINYSLFKRKPTLVLRQKKDNTTKDSYIEALESPLLTVKEYHGVAFKKIIDEFLGEAEMENGLARYNVVLDKKQKYYLDWASNQQKKSRSEILRQIINKTIVSDRLYKKFKAV
jgi:hypothetical protein